MKVKFANAEVDIWKLRKGVVIAYEYGGVNYGHLHSFFELHGGAVKKFIVQIDEWGNVSDFESKDVIWLEPHD